MPVLHTTILSVAIRQDSAGITLLDSGPRGVRVLGEANIDRSAAALVDMLGAECARLAGARRVNNAVLVLPSVWCATREIALTPADWASAKAGVIESLEDLVPIPADDAHVGLLGLCDESERCTRGVIVAAKRSVVDPIVGAMRQAVPDASVTVLSSSMAAIGLGHDDSAVYVTDEDDGSEPGVVLHGGLPVSQEPLAGENARRVVVGEGVSLLTLAAAGAVARRAAPDVIVPLVGERSRAAAKHLRAGLMFTAATLLLALVPMVWSARLENGANDAVARRTALLDDFRSSQAERARAERYAGLCEAFDSVTQEWESVTPVLRDAVGSIGDDGFFYRIRYEGGVLFFTGESSDPGSVLERLESSASLESASQTTPLTPSPIDPGLLVFTFRAEGVGR